MRWNAVSLLPLIATGVGVGWAPTYALGQAESPPAAVQSSPPGAYGTLAPAQAPRETGTASGPSEEAAGSSQQLPADRIRALRRAAKQLDEAGRVQLADQIRNEALLEEKREQLRKLQAEVAELQAATRDEQLVTLSVKLMELQTSQLKRLGFDFSTTGSIVETRGGQRPGGDGLLHGLLAALKSHRLLKVLAEPTLVTVSGREASFHAGGEVPIVVPQPGGKDTKVELLPIGTRLDCLPKVLGNGRIRLELRPSVSELDHSKSVVVGGASVPGLRTRRIHTAVELADGQTLILGGLVSLGNAEAEGSEPEETVLLVSVTAHLGGPGLEPLTAKRRVAPAR